MGGVDVASLSICRELYTLTSWDGVDRGWYDLDPYPHESNRYAILVDRYSEGGTILRVSPAYDVGFLLRKIEDNGEGYTISLSFVEQPELVGRRWVAEHRGCSGHGGRPVDAVARLIIELFRQGVWASAAT